jgi:hypothetical protein
MVATEIGCGSIDIRLASGGRANIFAAEDCCLLVDDDLLRQINNGAGIAIATCPNFYPASAGERLATVKSRPFVVKMSELEEVLSMVKENGPILQARPIRAPSVAVLYTDPTGGRHARETFEKIMRQRLERLGIRANFVLACVEEEGALAQSLRHLLRVKPTFVLIASTTAPAGPDDVVGCAMLRAGCLIERFLAPVDPGTLLLLGYKDDIPILSAPGCFHSTKVNVIDLLLPPILARYRLSGRDVAWLGHGGLLNCKTLPVRKAMHAAGF